MIGDRPVRRRPGRTWSDLYGPYVVVAGGLTSEYERLSVAIAVAEQIPGDNVIVGRRARRARDVLDGGDRLKNL